MKYIKIDIINNLHCCDYKLPWYLSTLGITLLTLYHEVVTSFAFTWVVFTDIGFYFI